MIISNLLPTALINHTSFIHRGRLYIVGGQKTSAPGVGVYQREVWSAGINTTLTTGKADLSLGDWTKAGPLPFPTTQQATGRDGELVYVVGGQPGLDNGNIDVTTSSNTRFFLGRIGPSGAIAWTKSNSGPPVLPVGVPLAFAMADGLMFVTGQDTIDGGSLNAGQVFGAKYNRSTGEIGVWKTLLPLPAAISDNQLFICGGLLLSIGGEMVGPVHQQIFWSVISQDGTIGNWNTLNFPGLDGRSGVAGVTIEDSVFFGGGWDNASDKQEVFRLQVIDRKPRALVQVGSLIQARDQMSCATDGKTLWFTGGENFAGTIQQNIEAIKVK